MTYEHSQPTAWRQTEFPWMSYAEGSPARTFPSQEQERGLPANGRAYGANTPDLLASYDLASSLWKTSQHSFFGGLETFSETWPRSGMMRSGIASRLPPLVRLTGEIASGLWPTPTANTSVAGISMATAWKEAQRLHPQGRWTLATKLAERALPTPRAQDWRSGRGFKPDGRGHTPQLRHIAGGMLNPRWIEWLMGFPVGWTNASHSATPSSRKSRS